MVITLLLSVALAAAPWPAKGDTVFVSAEITKAAGPYGAQEATVPACIPMLVTKTSKETWAMKDASGGFQRLRGPWLERFHRDAASCAEKRETAGQPWVVAEPFWVYRIVPTDAHPASP
jgi:hypothetical protein